MSDDATTNGNANLIRNAEILADELIYATAERDELAAALNEALPKLWTHERELAAAEASGRQQMIDALRAEARQVEKMRGIWSSVIAPWLDETLDNIVANQATPDTPTPRGYDYDTEGLGGT